jgi:hypothetical protein
MRVLDGAGEVIEIGILANDGGIDALLRQQRLKGHNTMGNFTSGYIQHGNQILYAGCSLQRKKRSQLAQPNISFTTKDTKLTKECS